MDDTFFKYSFFVIDPLQIPYTKIENVMQGLVLKCHPPMRCKQMCHVAQKSKRAPRKSRYMHWCALIENSLARGLGGYRAVTSMPAGTKGLVFLTGWAVESTPVGGSHAGGTCTHPGTIDISVPRVISFDRVARWEKVSWSLFLASCAYAMRYRACNAADLRKTTSKGGANTVFLIIFDLACVVHVVGFAHAVGRPS